MKLRDTLLEDTLRDMAESVEIPDNMWDEIRQRLNEPANVIPLPTARAHRPRLAAPPAPRRPYLAGMYTSMQAVAGLARVTLATAAVVAMALLPVAMVSGEPRAQSPSPDALAYLMPLDREPAEQPNSAGLALGITGMVRN